MRFTYTTYPTVHGSSGPEGVTYTAERFAPDGLSAWIGKPISIRLDRVVTMGEVRSVKVAEDGLSAQVTVEIPDESDAAQHLRDQKPWGQRAGFSVGIKPGMVGPPLSVRYDPRAMPQIKPIYASETPDS